MLPQNLRETENIQRIKNRERRERDKERKYVGVRREADSRGKSSIEAGTENYRIRSILQQQ